MNNPVPNTLPISSLLGIGMSSAPRGAHSTSAYLVMMLLLLKNSQEFQKFDIDNIRTQALTQGIMDNFMKASQNMNWIEMQSYLKKLSQDSFLTPGEKTQFSNEFKSLQAAAELMKGDSAAQNRINQAVLYLKAEQILEKMLPDLPSSLKDVLTSLSARKQFLSKTAPAFIKELLTAIFGDKIPQSYLDHLNDKSEMASNLSDLIARVSEGGDSFEDSLKQFFEDYLPQVSTKDMDQYNNWMNACDRILPSEAAVKSEGPKDAAQSALTQAQQSLSGEYTILETAVETVAAIDKTMTPFEDN